MPYAWINNQFVDEQEASVSIRDTGLLHAAGVFTTMRAYGGRVFRLDRHLDRLRTSCEHLYVPLSYKDEQLRSAVEKLLEKNGLADARLRITVTRGQAEQDPLHGLRLAPNVFITATPLEPYPDEFYRRGMTVIVLDEQKLNPYEITAGYKTLSYFPRLAALRSATQRGAGEALWFNVHNYLQSGSVANVFLVKDGRLLTPPTPREMQDKSLWERMPYPKSAVLPGITREAILEIAREEGIDAQPSAININELLEADEVFLTNSIMQVMPVTRIEQKPLGEGVPGHTTRRLTEGLDARIRQETA